MYPLLLLSVISWAVIVERLINLRTVAHRRKTIKDLKSLLADRNMEGAVELLSADNSHSARVLKELLKSYREGKLTKEDILKNLEYELSLMVPKVEKNLALLSTVASIAPLIGLFGTITGLIKVFSAFSVANPEEAMALLSKGISESLIAAATGLAVAIPALLAYWLFRIWGNSILSRIEEEFFEVIKFLR